MISKNAIIQDGAKIGKNVKIGNFVFISKDAEIGDECEIMQGACIYGNTKIAQNTKIFSYAVIGSIPQDLKYKGEKTELIIGKNNKIREYCLINPGTKGGGGITKIGNNNLFMGHTHIGHDCIFEDKIVVANSCAIAGHVEIASNTVIGGMSAIHQFVQIGEGVMVGGGAIVIQDIPPFCLAEGNRAILRGLNINGLRRKLQNRKDIDDIKTAYKKLFKSSNPLADSANELLKDYGDNKFIKSMAHFVLNTKRGIPYERK